MAAGGQMTGNELREHDGGGYVPCLDTKGDAAACGQNINLSPPRVHTF